MISLGFLNGTSDRSLVGLLLYRLGRYGLSVWILYLEIRQVSAGYQEGGIVRGRPTCKLTSNFVNPCGISMKTTSLFAIWFGCAVVQLSAATSSDLPVLIRSAKCPLPTLDLSGDVARKVMIAQGTAEMYQGHSTTVLLADGRTIYCVWAHNYGGDCGSLTVV